MGVRLGCGPEGFHPYACPGAGACRHCDRARVPGHDPARCALCDDGAPLRVCDDCRAAEAAYLACDEPEAEMARLFGDRPAGKALCAECLARSEEFGSWSWTERIGGPDRK